MIEQCPGALLGHFWTSVYPAFLYSPWGRSPPPHHSLYEDHAAADEAMNTDHALCFVSTNVRWRYSRVGGGPGQSQDDVN